MERVKKGEIYWSIRIFAGSIETFSSMELGQSDDEGFWDSGNYFRTKEEAEAMARKIRAVLNGADVIEPMLDDDKFATEVTFNGGCQIIPPKNHFIGTIVTTDRGKIVEFIDKSKIIK